jgi:hypothetical protein
VRIPFESKQLAILCAISAFLTWQMIDARDKKNDHIDKLLASCIKAAPPWIKANPNPEFAESEFSSRYRVEEAFCNPESADGFAQPQSEEPYPQREAYFEALKEKSESLEYGIYAMTLLTIMLGIPLGWRFLLARIIDLRIAITGK